MGRRGGAGGAEDDCSSLPSASEPGHSAAEMVDRTWLIAADGRAQTAAAPHKTRRSRVRYSPRSAGAYIGFGGGVHRPISSLSTLPRTQATSSQKLSLNDATTTGAQQTRTRRRSRCSRLALGSACSRSCYIHMLHVGRRVMMTSVNPACLPVFATQASTCTDMCR